jgi:hypothetical protein
MNRLGNDQNTCFWLDNWFGNKPLSIQYPTLFSHVQNSNINVADAYSEIGWQLRFRHITTHRAEQELISLLHELENVTLTEVPDEHFMRFGPNKQFSVKNCYYAMNWGGVTVNKTEELVLRDRLGRHLVGLNVRRDTTLRVLGLARLTRGLVR